MSTFDILSFQRHRFLLGAATWILAALALLAAPAEVTAFERVGAITLASDEELLTSAVIDPAGDFAYFGTRTSPGRVVKIDLQDFNRVDAIELEEGENILRSAVIDPAGAFAYFGTDTVPGRVVKIDLQDFTRVGAIELEEGPEELLSSAVIDPAGDFAYFGTNSGPGRVVKINLEDFTRVGAIELADGENNIFSAVIDPAGEFAYFGTVTDPGRVVKINLEDFTRVGAIELVDGESSLLSAVIDPAGEFAYFGTGTFFAPQDRVLKINLQDFERVDAITLDDDEDLLDSAVIDPAGEFAYFGTFTEPGRVVKIDLQVFFPVALMADPQPLMDLSDGNEVFEPGERIEVAPAWRNDGEFPQFLAGTASDFTGPAGPDYTLVMADADYGEVESGAVASCLDTGMCYQMEIGPAGGERPLLHWDATFDETLPDTTTTTWMLHLGDSFADVPPDHLFYRFVETALHHGMAIDCGDGEFCPNLPETREMMARTVLTALEGSDYVPDPCTEDDEIFADVPFTNPFCPWIEELSRRDIIAGCGNDAYCPEAPVTRAQMTVFLLKTLEGAAYVPPECEGLFADVPCPSTFADWIEQLADRGITAGCGTAPLEYCPGASITRGQCTVLQSKTFGLTLYGP